MELMEACVYVGDGELEVQDIPVPAAGSGDVLIEVAQCGICGSDLHLVLERTPGPEPCSATSGRERSWQPATGSTGWERRRPRGVRPDAGLRASAGPVGATDRRSASSVQPPDYLSFGGAFCRYVVVRADQLVRVPDTWPPAWPPSPSRRPSRSTR